jgi:hypothetical protein
MEKYGKIFSQNFIQSLKAQTMSRNVKAQTRVPPYNCFNIVEEFQSMSVSAVLKQFLFINTYKLVATTG